MEVTSFLSLPWFGAQQESRQLQEFMRNSWQRVELSFIFLYLLQANKTTSQDLFQHIQNEDPASHDAQTLDSATADQGKEQEKANFPEMHSDGEDEEEDSEMKSALLEEDEELPVSVAILQSPVTHEGNQWWDGWWDKYLPLPAGLWESSIDCCSGSM